MSTDEQICQEMTGGNPRAAPWAALKQFLAPRPTVERCELCNQELVPEHQHLVEPSTRKILCACDACAILFSQQADIKYRQTPRDSYVLQDFCLTDSEWDELLIPIGLAFFFSSSPAKKVVAIYPSPAGPTESLLELETWESLVENHPVLKELEPDTQALLVNRVGEARESY